MLNGEVMYVVMVSVDFSVWLWNAITGDEL